MKLYFDYIPRRDPERILLSISISPPLPVTAATGQPVGHPRNRKHVPSGGVAKRLTSCQPKAEQQLKQLKQPQNSNGDVLSFRLSCHRKITLHFKEGHPENVQDMSQPFSPHPLKSTSSFLKLMWVQNPGNSFWSHFIGKPPPPPPRQLKNSSSTIVKCLRTGGASRPTSNFNLSAHFMGLAGTIRDVPQFRLLSFPQTKNGQCSSNQEQDGLIYGFRVIHSVRMVPRGAAAQLFSRTEESLAARRALNYYEPFPNSRATGQHKQPATSSDQKKKEQRMMAGGLRLMASPGMELIGERLILIR